MSKKSESPFEAGQLWKYKNAAGEGNSRLLILKVETIDNQNIVHVTIMGGDIDYPQHMPFSEEAAIASVTELCAEACTIPEYEEGFFYWKEEFEKGQAGVYEVPVAEVLEL